jgi:hypothetical protein
MDSNCGGAKHTWRREYDERGTSSRQRRKRCCGMAAGERESGGFVGERAAVQARGGSDQRERVRVRMCGKRNRTVCCFARTPLG